MITVRPMLAIGQGRIPAVDPQTGELCDLVTRKELLKVRAAVTRSERGFFPAMTKP